ncbi:MAG: hypothetical protein OIF55_06860 [Amphritea sp.]|nr:hypothetical protein [Amphritea sp.]
MGTVRTLILGMYLVSSAAMADLSAGSYEIVLLDKQQAGTVVGTLNLKHRSESFEYALHMHHEQFQDYFLSMKEMKCLEGPELWCHLPYPYPQPRTISIEDMSWLSHDLLFMFKKPEEFGANFWNGIYYRLQISGDEISGQAQAVDLNMLASPPENADQPPLGEFERDEIDRDKRWLPDLIIRPVETD